MVAGLGLPRAPQLHAALLAVRPAHVPAILALARFAERQESQNRTFSELDIGGGLLGAGSDGDAGGGPAAAAVAGPGGAVAVRLYGAATVVLWRRWRAAEGGEEDEEGGRGAGRARVLHRVVAEMAGRWWRAGSDKRRWRSAAGGPDKGTGRAPRVRRGAGDSNEGAEASTALGGAGAAEPGRVGGGQSRGRAGLQRREKHGGGAGGGGGRWAVRRGADGQGRGGLTRSFHADSESDSDGDSDGDAGAGGGADSVAAGKWAAEVVQLAVDSVPRRGVRAGAEAGARARRP